MRIRLLTTALLLTSCVEISSQAHLHRFRQRSNEERRRSDEWLERYAFNSFSVDTNECPCPRPVTPVDSSSYGTILGFSDASSTGEFYNWTYAANMVLAWAHDELVCSAHCHGARALVAAPSYNLTHDLNVTDWVQKSMVLVQSRHYDGIVFDYESPVTTQEAHTYVKLIRATRQACQKHGLLVVTCVAWSPDGIDGRNYPAVALARASDFLYVMDYDTQSQIISGPCIAAANAPFAGMIRGMERYLQLGIDPKKLILGVPWYGYRYPCLRGTKRDAQFCPIRKVPFRGVNCSDAAGAEIAYTKILAVNRNMTANEIQETGGIRRDDYMDAAYMNDVSENGTVFQYWFDDATSIRNKFAWAKTMGLGGVGPFTFDDLDPVEFPKESQEMWSAFDTFVAAGGGVGNDEMVAL